MPKSLEELKGLVMEYACDVARAIEATGVVVDESAVYRALCQELTYREITEILCQ